MPIEFPQDLVFYMQPQHTGKTLKDVKGILQNHVVLEQAKTWLDNNSKFVNKSKNLQDIRACVVEQYAIESTVSKVDQLVDSQIGAKRKRGKSASEKPSKRPKANDSKVCLGIENQGVDYLLNVDVKTFKKNLPLILHYFQMGVLTEENLSAIIASKSPAPNKKKTQVCDFYHIFHRNMKSIQPILDNCSESQLFCLFSFPHNSLIRHEYASYFGSLYPYVEKLLPEQLERILLSPCKDFAPPSRNSTPSNRNSEFLTFMLKADFERVVRLFNQMTPKQRANIFSAYGIYHEKILALTHQFIATLDSKTIKKIFTRNPCLSFIGYQTEEYQNHVQQLLDLLPAQDLIEVLALKDEKQNTAMHNPFNWSFLIKVLRKLDAKPLFTLYFLTKNSHNTSPWFAPQHYIYLLSKIKIVPSSLQVRTLNALASQPDKVDLDELEKSSFKDAFCYQLNEIGDMMQTLYKECVAPLLSEYLPFQNLFMIHLEAWFNPYCAPITLTTQLKENIARIIKTIFTDRSTPESLPVLEIFDL